MGSVSISTRGRLSGSLNWLTFLSSPQFISALQNWFHIQRVTGLGRWGALKDACCSSFHIESTAPHGSLSTAVARLHPGLAKLAQDAEMQSLVEVNQAIKAR